MCVVDEKKICVGVGEIRGLEEDLGLERGVRLVDRLFPYCHVQEVYMAVVEREFNVGDDVVEERLIFP